MGEVKYLLDTNILSEPLVQRPNAGVMARIEADAEQLALSVISWQEMVYGMKRMAQGKRRAQIERYLTRHLQGVLPILPFDQPAADWQAEQRAQLTGKGLKPGYADSQIAAIAATQGLILVTRNLSDFQHFEGLDIENWFS
jgi:tRNA(fMet)-specific endonuclease VapC